MDAKRKIPPALTRFLMAVDASIREGQRLEVVVAGAAAMLLGYEQQTFTEDVDFIGIETGLLAELSEIAGEGSEIHRTTSYYLDILPPGKFPQEWGWKNRAIPVAVPGLQNIELKVLELHDLVLSKLKRFSGKDREDIELLCYLGDFEIGILRERYRHARRLYDYDEREELDGNFRFVEEELLSIEPTTFD